MVALYREVSSELEALRKAAPDRVELHEVDVRRSEDFQRVADALSANERFDLLVYNAAVHLEHERVDIARSNADDVLETLDVNAVGAVRAMKHLGRFVDNGGLVVLISSEAGSLTDNWRATEYGYCMSKAALNMLARLLSVREHDRGSRIQVVAMHPGWLRTDMGGANADVGADEAARDIVDTLSARYGSGGPDFVDRFGKAMAW